MKTENTSEKLLNRIYISNSALKLLISKFNFRRSARTSSKTYYFFLINITIPMIFSFFVDITRSWFMQL